VVSGGNRGIVRRSKIKKKSGLPANAFGMRSLKAMAFSGLRRLAVLTKTTRPR